MHPFNYLHLMYEKKTNDKSPRTEREKKKQKCVACVQFNYYRIVLMVFRCRLPYFLKRNHVYNSNVYICFVAAAAAVVFVVFLRVISVCA